MWSMSHIGIETCCTSSRDNVDWIYFLRSLLKSAMCRVCVQLPNSWKSLSSSLCSTCAHVELHLSLWSPQIRDWWNLKGRRNTALSCCSCQHLEPSHGLISPVIKHSTAGVLPWWAKTNSPAWEWPLWWGTGSCWWHWMETWLSWRDVMEAGVRMWSGESRLVPGCQHSAIPLRGMWSKPGLCLP